MSGSDRLPSPSLYDRDYFLSSACEGLRDYLNGGLASLKERELEHLSVEPGMTFLDIGCGRGETAAEAARRGAQVVAVDYSSDAVALTRELLGRSVVVRADGSALPFRSASVDRVLMGDIIEHVPWAVARVMLVDANRVLRTGGRALVHTSPNTYFISIVKPVLQIALRLMRRDDVLFRFREYDRLRVAMHPNELNPFRLRRLMRETGLPARTWVDRDVVRGGSSEWTEELHRGRLFRLAGSVAGAWPLRLVFGNDMFGLVEKAAGPRA